MTLRTRNIILCYFISSALILFALQGCDQPKVECIYTGPSETVKEIPQSRIIKKDNGIWVRLDFQSEKLSVVAQTIFEANSKGVIVLSSVGSRKITMYTLSPVRADKAMDLFFMVLEAEQLTIEEEEDDLVIIKKKPRPIRDISRRNYSTDKVNEPSSDSDIEIKKFEKVAGTKFSISRSSVKELLATLESDNYKPSYRLIPNYKNGQPTGIKIVGIRPGSFLAQSGIRSGDVILGDVTEQIREPIFFKKFFDELLLKNTVTINIERRGQPKTLTYVLEKEVEIKSNPAPVKKGEPKKPVSPF